MAAMTSCENALFTLSVTKCCGSWVVGSGWWVWLVGVGKMSWVKKNYRKKK